MYILCDDIILFILYNLDNHILDKIRCVNKHFSGLIKTNEEDIYKKYVIRDFKISDPHKYLTWKEMYKFCNNLDLTGCWKITNKFLDEPFAGKIQKYDANILMKNNTFEAQGYIPKQATWTEEINYKIFGFFNRYNKLEVIGTIYFLHGDYDNNDSIYLGFSKFIGKINLEDCNNNIVNIESKYKYQSVEDNVLLNGISNCELTIT